MAQKWKVLLIDDDTLLLEAFRLVLPENWDLTSHSTPQNIPNGFFHIAFVDLHLNERRSPEEGLAIIKDLKAKHPNLEIVAVSGVINRALMEQTLLAGASRFLAKPFSYDEIFLILEKVEAYQLLHQATQRGSKKTFWMGSSPTFDSIKKQIAMLRGEPGPILIEGESGTGKEIVVEMLKEQDPGRPSLAINISSISENLFESEIFGHMRGSFTGADQNKMGLAEAAHGGDLFLDEIEALSLPNQVKLLRFLESNEVRRIGSKEITRIDVRIIVATNQNLEALVSEGKFREDLLWRLNGKKILLPPLRSRKEDIPELAKFFLNQKKPRYNKVFSDESLTLLKSHSWPGNIRELKRIVEQICITSPLPIIRTEDISPLLSKPTNLNPPKHDSHMDLSLGMNNLVESYEKIILEKCLERSRDLDQISELLKISKSSIYKKIKDYSINY